MIHFHGECQNLNDTYIQDWVTQMANTRKYGGRRQILFATKDQKQKIYLITCIQRLNLSKRREFIQTSYPVDNLYFINPCVKFFGME